MIYARTNVWYEVFLLGLFFETNQKLDKEFFSSTPKSRTLAISLKCSSIFLYESLNNQKRVYISKYIFPDIQNSLLQNNKYRVGGFFNVTIGEWQWIDGSLVFDTIDRTLTDVNDDEGELLWHELAIFRDFDIGRTERLLCERII